MQIKQFEDKNLSQYSYAILNESEGKIILIDPSRNAELYIDWAKTKNADIIAVIETHPHADFISSHLELHQRVGATLYAHSLVGVSYPHQSFDDGAVIGMGDIRLTSLHTPGHSPDSISILLEHAGKQKAVFTGDTLFIGDCGRPDLREGAGNMKVKREDLARQMYHSLRHKLMTLDDDVLVYPAHGAGTLCGKSLSKESSSTIGLEKQTNWSLQDTSEEAFVANLLTDQPFIPGYFPFDVELNRTGAAWLKDSIGQVNMMNDETEPVRGLDAKSWIIDVRSSESFKNGHYPHSINLMEDGKFETWLGSIIKPREKFYLAGDSREQLQRVIERTASIGYETAIAGAFIAEGGAVHDPLLDISHFESNLSSFTIVDVRNTSEVRERQIFSGSLHIPLAEMRDRYAEIPTDKPIVIHCAGGYRSAAASSLVQSGINGKVPVFDLGEAVREF